MAAGCELLWRSLKIAAAVIAQLAPHLLMQGMGAGDSWATEVRQLLCACGSVWWLEVQANYRWLGCVRPGGERIGVVMGCVGWPGAGTYRVYALCVCMLHV